MMAPRRRDFLRACGGLAATALPGWPAIGPTSARAGEEAAAEAVRFLPGIETLVRWIEECPRDRIVEEAVARLRRGLPERQLVAALFLAGIRNVKPRPVGFKFHAVMVMGAAHELSLDAAADDRLLPFFWALDNFKAAQAQDVKEGDWTLGPVDEPRVPGAGRARQLFIDAMEAWDAAAADVAVTALCRSCSAGEIQELVWPYGIRDQRNIGHKAIFTSQAFRTLDVVGWEHAEPVLRSLVFGLLDGGPTDTAAAFAPNRERAAAIDPGWVAGRPDAGVTAAFLETLREADSAGAAAAAAEAIGRGVAAASLWDALLLAGSELLMRRPMIITLHATTGVSALFHGFRRSADDATRLLCLLQAAAWLPLYRAFAGRLPDGPLIDRFEPADDAGDPAAVFDGLGRDRLRAAARVLAHLDAGGDPEPFRAAARHLALTKGNDPHDFKFPAAAFEDAAHASPVVRSRLLAASVFFLKDGGAADSAVVSRVRQAMESS